MKTSASRQLALSWTPRQSLLNRLIVVGLSRFLRRWQISFASSTWALPLKMTIAFTRFSLVGCTSFPPQFTRHLAVARHSRTVLSSLPVANVLPSEENAIEVICDGTSITLVSSPVSRFQNSNLPFPPAFQLFPNSPETASKLPIRQSPEVKNARRQRAQRGPGQNQTTTAPDFPCARGYYDRAWWPDQKRCADLQPSV